MTTLDVQRACATAQAADTAYDETIQAYIGPGATRWSLTPNQEGHPEVRAARMRARVTAGYYHDACAAWRAEHGAAAP